MATYCYRCPVCGYRAETNERFDAVLCIGDHVDRPHPAVDMKRDYRAENVGVAVEQLKQEREAGGREAYKRMFLPHNDDFKGPGDPDGTIGMRRWRDEHQPKAGNANPDWPGHVDKKVM